MWRGIAPESATSRLTIRTRRVFGRQTGGFFGAQLSVLLAKAL